MEKQRRDADPLLKDADQLRSIWGSGRREIQCSKQWSPEALESTHLPCQPHSWIGETVSDTTSYWVLPQAGHKEFEWKTFTRIVPGTASSLHATADAIQKKGVICEQVRSIPGRLLVARSFSLWTTSTNLIPKDGQLD